jgi:hypothetical protein
VHFVHIASTGVIYKAYENDGVHFPTDAASAIEGQRVCRYWTARAVFDRRDVSSRTRRHRHHLGYILVHRCSRPDSGGTVLGEGRSALHPGEVDARTRDNGALHVQVPRSRLLVTAARGPGHPLGRTGVAQHPGAFTLAGRHAAWSVPGVDDTEVLKFLERHGGA